MKIVQIRLVKILVKPLIQTKVIDTGNSPITADPMETQSTAGSDVENKTHFNDQIHLSPPIRL